MRPIGWTASWSLALLLGVMSLHAAPGQDEWIDLLAAGDLDGWIGDKTRWRVEDGVLTGETTAQYPLVANTYLHWEGIVEDFELTCEFRIEGGNSGIQYRSRPHEGSDPIAGYQADLDAMNKYTGVLYEANGRGLMTSRGEHAKFTEQGKKEILGSHGDTAELSGVIRKGEWNTYHIRAVGPHLVHAINGHVMSEVIDEDPDARSARGLIALQLHAGPPMLVQYRALRIRHLSSAAQGEPEWIWFNQEIRDEQAGWFEFRFLASKDAESASFQLTCDNHFIALLNGEQIASGDNWQRVAVARNVALIPGENILLVKAWNDTGPAGLIASIDIASGGKTRRLVSNSSWHAMEGVDATDPFPNTPAISLGPASGPDGPWPDPFTASTAPAGDSDKVIPMRGGGFSGPPTSSLDLVPGFTFDLLYEARADEGSWVCMTFDDQGRLIISPQSGGLVRLTLPVGRQEARVEPINLPVGSAQGLLVLDGSLYVNMVAKKDQGGGLHRLRDTDGDDAYDSDELLASWGWPSEHGAHGIIAGPDGMIYLVNGNHTHLPDEIDPASPHRNWGEDVLSERLWDPMGHAVGIMAPGAFVLRTDPAGTRWELYAAGMRNPYDLAFNRDGELFTYDADMEYDMGTAWYRPPRLVHVVPGGEYGWRSGTAKWPVTFPDSLPAVVNTGPSSPTGMVSGMDSSFPEPWRSAMFLGDWAYGRILAVHLEPTGATFRGKTDVFASGRPLNVCDMVFGPEGAMYVLTGGRGTQSALYRIQADPVVLDPGPVPFNTGAHESRVLRRHLEALQGDAGAGVIDEVFHALASPDRWIRYAARLALERQDPAIWTGRALDEDVPVVALEALLALVRTGKPALQHEILEQLGSLAIDRDRPEEACALLRIYGLSIQRLGELDARGRSLVLGKIDAWYPAGSFERDRLLVELLVYLDAPGVIERTVTLLEQTTLPDEALYYALMLRSVDSGWTAETRGRYGAWIEAAGVYQGGRSMQGFVAAIAEDARVHAQISVKERTGGGSLTGDEAGTRSFVQHWTLKDFLGDLGKVGHSRSLDSGREAYHIATCHQCHLFAGAGGTTGPDITAVASRFTRRDLLQAILEPSHVVSDQYELSIVIRTDGSAVIGRIIERTDAVIGVNVDPYGFTRVTIPIGELDAVEPYPASAMPGGLVDTLTREEVLDLLAYLESGVE